MAVKMKKGYWKTLDGTTFKISTLTDGTLCNLLIFGKKSAEEKRQSDLNKYVFAAMANVIPEWRAYFHPNQDKLEELEHEAKKRGLKWESYTSAHACVTGIKSKTAVANADGMRVDHWQTKDGTIIKISQMTDDHLCNALRWGKKTAVAKMHSHVKKNQSSQGLHWTEFFWPHRGKFFELQKEAAARALNWETGEEPPDPQHFIGRDHSQGKRSKHKVKKPSVPPSQMPTRATRSIRI